MTRYVRRGLRGTNRPHLTASPAGDAVFTPPEAAGSLPGAACTGADPDLFFPDDDADNYGFCVLRAKDICSGCPVRDMCLALAMERGEKHGIFGGLTPYQRHLLKDRQRKQVA
ncbi:WhiB family transcriptional regulator [Kitasatospora sp. NPDC088346]|uniref:WhiB family transcriptional regulator n=1 Tax=Kitasatospora sp. NPDC088346 TaxID=3364073 RepID=UPI0038212472